MEHRTIAAPTGYFDYTHDGRAGCSWTTPWLAEVYLLAKQVNPKITPEHFWETALKTGHMNKRNGVNVIQPVKLIETIQKEYSRGKTSTLTKTLGKHCVKKIPCKRQGKELK